MEFSLEPEGETRNGMNEHAERTAYQQQSFVTSEQGDAVDQTGLLPTDASALEQVPDRQVGDEGDPVADRLVAETLRDGEAIDRTRDLKQTQAEALEQKIENMQRDLGDLQQEVIESADQFSARYTGARVVLWNRMEKGADGYARGEDNMRRVVDLSPEAYHPDPTEQRAERERLAAYNNSRVKADTPTVMMYEDGAGGTHYQGGVPTADGFAIGLEDGEARRFMFGITEPVVFADESWPVYLKWGSPEADQPENVVASNVYICRGEEDTRNYLQDVAQSVTMTLESVTATFSQEGSGGMDANHFQSLLRQRVGARRQLTEIGLAANAIGLNFASEGWSPEARDRIADAFRDQLFERIGNAPEGDAECVEAAQAMQPLFLEGETETLADYLIRNSQERPIGPDRPDTRAGVLRILVDVCGMDPDMAERRLYLY